MTPTRRALLQATGALLLGAAGRAQALDKPTGPVVLSFTGRVRSPNAGANPGIRADFDMAMLERLPQTSFTTRTPWYAQARKFTGPLLRDLLAAAGANGSTLRLVALNDYWVEIPVEDTALHDVIVARLLDDKPMAVRDKGPLFVIYPFDSSPELRNPVHYGRSAWQLRTIDVR